MTDVTQPTQSRIEIIRKPHTKFVRLAGSVQRHTSDEREWPLLDLDAELLREQRRKALQLCKETDVERVCEHSRENSIIQVFINIDIDTDHKLNYSKSSPKTLHQVSSVAFSCPICS